VRELKKGLTTLIVLSALEEGELYGYGLRREVSERTRGAFGFSEGALYPLLHGLQRKGWVGARFAKVRGRERKYYALTSEGRRALTALRQDWQQLLDCLRLILR
jgi:DNA-binding PadR family transcriptional regulator